MKCCDIVLIASAVIAIAFVARVDLILWAWY
jgi:hypothetical protein